MDEAGFGKPRYKPELNEGLGGTIELTDGYVFPVDLPARKVRSILEDQAGNGTVKDSQFPYFSLEIGDDKQYDLLHAYGEDHPVDAIALYDSDEGETVGFYDMEELTEQADLQSK